MQLDSDDWQQLHPLSPVLRAGRALIVLLVIATQSISAILSGGILLLIGSVLLLVGSIAYGYFGWLFTRFRLQDDAIELREGVLSRSHKRVPLARIETVDVIRPVIARIFGLAEVRVEVAGAKDSGLSLEYLLDSEAVALRERLLSMKSDATMSHDALDNAEVFRPHQHEEVVAQVANSDVLLGYALMRAGIPIVLLVVAVFVLLPLDFDAAAAVFVSSLLPLAVWMVAVAKQLESLWNFRLSKSDGGFALRRGLLNLLTQKVPLHRVQAVSIVTPLIWRPFQCSRLVVDIAGYGNEGGVELRTTSVLLPIGPPATVRAVLNEIFPDLDLDSMNFEEPPATARWRAPLIWRTYGVSWTPAFAITRAGILRRRIDIVPHRKIQSLRITCGPWQKRLGLATLHVDSAGRNVWCEAKHRKSAQAFELAKASRRADSFQA